MWGEWGSPSRSDSVFTTSSRASPVTFSLPLTMWGRAAVTVSITSGICPPSTSVIDCADALYFTLKSGACADFTNCANTTLAVVLPPLSAFVFKWSGGQ